MSKPHWRSLIHMAILSSHGLATPPLMLRRSTFSSVAPQYESHDKQQDESFYSTPKRTSLEWTGPKAVVTTPSAALPICIKKSSSTSANGVSRTPTPNLVLPTVDGYTVSHSLLRSNLPQDSFGFVLDERHGFTMAEYRNAELQIQTNIVKQKKTWDFLILAKKENLIVFPPASEKVKSALRKGLYPEIRANAWYFYSGAQARHDAQPKRYSDLVKYCASNGLDSPLYEQIEADVQRAFISNTRFHTASLTSPYPTVNGPCWTTDDTPQQSALKRMIIALCVALPNISYSSGITSIASTILLVTQDEVRSFWILFSILEEILPSNYFVDMNLGCNVDQEVLLALLEWKSPAIHRKIVDLQMPLNIVTSTWFSALFVEQVPFETLVRVWDAFLFEGSKVLLRMAWALFKINERSILSIHDYFDLTAYIRNMARSQIDIPRLFYEAFENIGSFPGKWIEEQRLKFLPELRAKHSIRRFSRISPAFCHVSSPTPRHQPPTSDKPLFMALEDDDMPIFERPTVIESDADNISIN